ncbi:MAG: hypothetical protein ACLFRB_06245 [Thiohalorhabdus sp.]|uniref:hypothetical protein n=1 Tax=Thiohalorhabdus sp. TaxID=3094134 RepID=UPI0039803C0F
MLDPTIFRLLVVAAFSNFFLAVAVAMGGLAIVEMAGTLLRLVGDLVLSGGPSQGLGFEKGESGENFIAALIKGLNLAIIALAALELAMGIYKEYGGKEEGGNLYRIVRRTITRFVSLASIALVLEALLLVIKYSHLDLAANLTYPVAILGGTSALLLGLGGFLAMTRSDEVSAGQGGAGEPQAARGSTPRRMPEPVGARAGGAARGLRVRGHGIPGRWPGRSKDRPGPERG